MNEVLEGFAVNYLTKNDGRCTKDDLFSAMKARFEKSVLQDFEIEQELTKSEKIIGTIENGTGYYTLRNFNKS